MILTIFIVGIVVILCGLCVEAKGAASAAIGGALAMVGLVLIGGAMMVGALYLRHAGF